MNKRRSADLFFYTLNFCVAFLIFTGAIKAQSFFPEGVQSPFRSQMVLNGIWQFQPAVESAASPTSADWGELRVPGAWAVNDAWWTNVPGVITRGRGRSWQTDLALVNRCWYRQTVFVPAHWQKGAVLLRIDRVATDAVVFVNGQKAGAIGWYAGAVEVTRQVKFGAVNEIQLLVIATPDEGEVANLMGTADAQVSFSKANLVTRGLTGDVSLVSRPANSFITDVFVQPSVRKKMLAVEVEWQAPTLAKATLNIEVKDERGDVVKKFQREFSTTSGKATIAVDWPDARLWDLDQPNLYQLQVSLLHSGTVVDTYVQPFGFREFWIEGKNFYLNGTRINLRPALEPPGEGMLESTEAGIRGLQDAGFNFAELWPNNFDVRGYIQNWHTVMDVADKKGFLLSGVVLPFTFYMVSRNYAFRWDSAGVKAQWEQRMLQELKRQRNHPSVVIWGTAPNFFGHAQDQNPLLIGQRNWIKENDFWQRNAKAAAEAIALIKQHDPTRPVYTHHGAYVGDVHTLNFYLNLLPLQEREDWLSHYAQHGTMPFMGIEFGTPLYCTFLRGRNGYSKNVQSEPLVTEFAAMYLGRKAYTDETPAYRQLIRANFLGGQQYKPLTAPAVIEAMPSFSAVQHLFTKNTWRSWRTWEIGGGLLPWDRGHGWVKKPAGMVNIQMPPFTPGRKGAYFPELPAHALQFLNDSAWQRLPAGDALVQNNGAVLAYIGGSEEAFTAKNHHYRPGSLLQKQVFLFNDTRHPQTAKWQASVTLNETIVWRDSGTAYLPAGSKAAQKIDCQLPKTVTAFRSNGIIQLTATIAGKKLQDSFSFRVFMPPVASEKTVFVYDPEGTTTAVLQREGFSVQQWDGKAAIPFLLVGRNALLSQYRAPFNIEPFVQGGGKLLVMAQHPDSVAARRGFRTSPYVSRYVFPVDTVHSLFTGLDENDLRNWNGSSRLTEAFPDYLNQPVKKGAYNLPYYGWHWGNRGGVSSASIEKPHRSAWRPLLECEFDLAWSPLMELPFGKGHLVWNNLDLEDHLEADVIAQLLLHRLLNYIDTLKPAPRKKVLLWGNESDAALLNDLGLSFTQSRKRPAAGELLLIGHVQAGDERNVLDFIKSGGSAVVLPRQSNQPFAGVHYRYDSSFLGSGRLSSWPEAAGLSLSDLRYRVEGAAWLLDSGCAIDADGLLGKKRYGRGDLLFVQIDPKRLPADSLTYYRFTRWRQTRALSQVLANAGASFRMDAAFFQPQTETTTAVDLEGEWKVALTAPLPAAKEAGLRYMDPGLSNEAKKYIAPAADERGMETVVAGVSLERSIPAWKDKDGEVVLRKTIDIPAHFIGKPLTLQMGILDDYDQVFINGVLVGESTVHDEPVWNKVRTYSVQAGIVQEGKNVIAIRLFDTFGEGGLMPGNTKRQLQLLNAPKPLSFYHPDYRDDFEMGDDPFRYYRW